jgi:hypothetical protein
LPSGRVSSSGRLLFQASSKPGYGLCSNPCRQRLGSRQKTRTPRREEAPDTETTITYPIRCEH